jgi:hypothetical protein
MMANDDESIIVGRQSSEAIIAEAACGLAAGGD